MTDGRLLAAGGAQVDQDDVTDADHWTVKYSAFSTRVPALVSEYVQDGPLVVSDSRDDLQGLVANVNARCFVAVYDRNGDLSHDST